IGGVEDEAGGWEQGGDGVQVLLGKTEPLAELPRRQPFVEIRRIGIMEFINELYERLLQLRRALQLEKHVLQKEVIRHYATVIIDVGFVTSVALERGQFPFIDGFHD